jgi:catechol 2,3-dioxygenase-like lactoylglutathione lyase family enzyme
VTVLHHAGVCCRDIEESLRFYRDGIGLVVLADVVLAADLKPLLGVSTTSVRTVFLGEAEHPDAGIVELLDLGVAAIADADAQAGIPARGVFLLSLQLGVEVVLERLAAMGLGGTPLTMTVPGGKVAATVVDPDGVQVELLPLGGLSVMKAKK